MDYEQKYKEALERAKEFVSKDVVEALEYIFPELIEGEDERIRKEIIDFLWKEKIFLQEVHSAVENNPKYRFVMDAIAWLEKQGDTDEIINRDELAQDILKGAAINLITWIDYNAAEGNMCLSNTECKDIGDALVSGNWDKIYAYIKKKLEKHGEQTHAELGQSEVTKTSEQELELKFHPGDWIIRSAEGFKHNTYLVKEVNDYYVCEELNGRQVTFTFNDVHNNFKLWDISDAKDGDVLASKDGFVILIFKNLYTNISFSSYYNTTSKGEFGWSSNCFIPATKEQRDKLFHKMKKAGYEWNSEKKELKKK